MPINQLLGLHDMDEFFVNINSYGLILLRDNYEDALAESEEMYDKECESKKTPTPKSERGTKYLLGIKENILSGQVGLHIPSRKLHIEVPASAITGEHVDNPLWVNYDFIHGEPKMVIGALPFGGFGFGLVDPVETRKILEGNYSSVLIEQVRGSARKYTIDVHNRIRDLIQEFLKQSNVKEHLIKNINADLFEELVADLLRNQGFDVFLTSRTGDGGKDIWASTVLDERRVTALVECKVRGSKSALDPALARAVVGAYFIEKARGVDVDCALMVTTSENIGPETLSIQQQIRTFSVKHCGDVIEWIRHYGEIRNGLWVPRALSSFLF
jgi:hypothetical protein